MYVPCSTLACCSQTFEADSCYDQEVQKILMCELKRNKINSTQEGRERREEEEGGRGGRGGRGGITQASLD